MPLVLKQVDDAPASSSSTTNPSGMHSAEALIEELISALDEIKAAGVRSVILQGQAGRDSLVGRPRCFGTAQDTAEIPSHMKTRFAASCGPSR